MSKSEAEIDQLYTWWLSFAGRGVAIVDEVTADAAVQKAWRLNINPGGDVACIRMPLDHPEALKVGKDRLVSLEELCTRGYEKKSAAWLEERFSVRRS